MSNASEKMFQVVAAIESSAQKAEREFERQKRELEWKSSSQIDLFGFDVTERVVELVSGGRKACDELYASYQMLVKMLDDRCRPLLSGQPSADAVRAVCRMIKKLNDESEIKNNYTTSLNNYSLGDVATVQYTPMMENKVIQKYWETTLEQMDGTETKKDSQKKKSSAKKTNPVDEDAIMQFFFDRPNEKFTIPELIEICNFPAGSNQVVYGIVRGLMNRYVVERIEEDRQAYFKLI